MNSSANMGKSKKVNGTKTVADSGVKGWGSRAERKCRKMAVDNECKQTKVRSESK